MSAGYFRLSDPVLIHNPITFAKTLGRVCVLCKLNLSCVHQSLLATSLLLISPVAYYTMPFILILTDMQLKWWGFCGGQGVTGHAQTPSILVKCHWTKTWFNPVSQAENPDHNSGTAKVLAANKSNHYLYCCSRTNFSWTKRELGIFWGSPFLHNKGNKWVAYITQISIKRPILYRFLF